MKILHNLNSTTLWYQLIVDAEALCDITLKEELEAYLVFLMMRYISKPEIAKQVVASDFLKGIQLAPHQRARVLQEVGDKCLLFSGLFPEMTEKRLVKLSYFVNIGQSSYAHLSHSHNDLYASLSTEFVTLMDLLQSLRQYTKKYPDLLPIQAYDLWNETGSQHALSILKHYTDGSPVPVDHLDVKKK